MTPLTPLLSLQRGAVVAVVGCGGKSSLIEQLAKENRTKRVLIAPTTKILAPKTGAAAVLCDEAALLAHGAVAGAQYVGCLNRTTGKLEGFAAEVIAAVKERYDLVLMEADGSRGLPCKGWLENEPPVPAFADVTVGVVSIGALGLPAAERYVLRLPQFLALTGLCAGQPITAMALAAMVAAPGGMFKNRVGRTALLINQVETQQAEEEAAALVGILRRQYPGVIGSCFWGSVHEGRWRLADG